MKNGIDLGALAWALFLACLAFDAVMSLCNVLIP
jgi:hypothetical protein